MGKTIDALNGREKTDFSLFVLVAHGKFTWECEECDCLTNSLVLAGEHMREEHPELVRECWQSYAALRM